MSDICLVASQHNLAAIVLGFGYVLKCWWETVENHELELKYVSCNITITC